MIPKSSVLETPWTRLDDGLEDEDEGKGDNEAMIVAEAEWGTPEEEQSWRQGLRHINSEISATPKWWSLHENSNHLYLVFCYIPRSHPSMSCQQEIFR